MNAVIAVSKRQETVAEQATGAEMIDFSEGCKDLIYTYTRPPAALAVPTPRTREAAWRPL